MKLLLALGLLVSPNAPAQTAAPREVNEERIAAAFADVRSALKEVLGVEVDAKFQPRIVGAKDVAARVALENLPVIRLRQPDPALAQSEADAIGQQFGQSALAKYTWATKELLVSAKTWRRQAAMMNRPALTSDEALRAVLVHEVVHALDDARYDIGKVIGGLPSIDAVQGLNGVLEGHAQLLARRVCEKRGWKSGFDVFSANIGGVPEGAESLAAAQLDLLRAQGAIAAAPYVAGEAFMTAVEARGAEFVARAFRTPPETPDLLYRPDWWLEPAQRPKSRFTLGAALDAFGARYPSEQWSSAKMTLPRAGLEASMTRIGPERVRTALDGRITSTSITLQPRADPSSKLVSLALHEFVDEKGALAFFTGGTELGKARDEDMRRPDASLRLVELASEPIQGEGWRAAVERRKLDSAGFVFVATAVRAQVKELVVELVFSNEPAETEDLAALVRSVIATATRK